jgi:hypothetical protein
MNVSRRQGEPLFATRPYDEVFVEVFVIDAAAEFKQHHIV